jgi:hypothetical protein
VIRYQSHLNLKLEKVIYSNWIFINSSKRLWHLIFGKKEKLVITTEQIIQCSSKNGEISTASPYQDLMGITKSIWKDSQNFIMHFKGKPCFEMQCEMREEILDII